MATQKRTVEFLLDPFARDDWDDRDRVAALARATAAALPPPKSRRPKAGIRP